MKAVGACSPDSPHFLEPKILHPLAESSGLDTNLARSTLNAKVLDSISSTSNLFSQGSISNLTKVATNCFNHCSQLNVNGHSLHLSRSNLTSVLQQLNSDWWISSYCQLKKIYHSSYHWKKSISLQEGTKTEVLCCHKKKCRCVHKCVFEVFFLCENLCTIVNESLLSYSVNSPQMPLDVISQHLLQALSSQIS